LKLASPPLFIANTAIQATSYFFLEGSTSTRGENKVFAFDVKTNPDEKVSK
jgi:hypothetical protein